MTTKSRPIIMSSDSVRAILDGRKTQTRRVVKPQPMCYGKSIAQPCKEQRFYSLPEHTGKRFLVCAECGEHVKYSIQGQHHRGIESPYGIGDRLWVREKFRYSFWSSYEGTCVIQYADNQKSKKIDLTRMHWEPEIQEVISDNWKSPLFLPRWASRLTLEITNVRCERVQEITLNDVWDEGYKTITDFKKAWDALNAKRGYGWDTNPLVWVIEFEKIEGGDNE